MMIEVVSDTWEPVCRGKGPVAPSPEIWKVELTLSLVIFSTNVSARYQITLSTFQIRKNKLTSISTLKFKKKFWGIFPGPILFVPRKSPMPNFPRSPMLGESLSAQPNASLWLSARVQCCYVNESRKRPDEK